MTKLSKSIKREVSLPKVRNGVIISIDAESKKIILNEKGCRRKYGIDILTLFELLIIRDMKEGKNE